MSAKELVQAFYNADVANDNTLVETFFHKECELHWNSSSGFSIKKYNDVIELFDGIRESYLSLRFDITHLLESENFVTSRHHVFAQTIEQRNEHLLAHFVAIWEVKENKLFRGYELSQQADKKTLEV